jgi:hypothetical protein
MQNYNNINQAAFKVLTAMGTKMSSRSQLCVGWYEFAEVSKAAVLEGSHFSNSKTFNMYFRISVIVTLI